jgi:hypothetical protein
VHQASKERQQGHERDRWDERERVAERTGKTNKKNQKEHQGGSGETNRGEKKKNETPEEGKPK